ncbi:MAG: helix-turn-helix domain-containing protein [Lachnospiraceae bacterium]|nr:helix-turn-helix domain-containing protein [Lachnospiraceae bacterium]MCD7766829.1 helix-turn-helix domain-containing protein [Lachnospiraceae bacterium]
MDLMEIGSRIKQARRSEKLTQEQLAEMVNVSPHYIYEIEQGRKTMSLETLERISSELHLSLDYLFWGTVAPGTDKDAESASAQLDRKVGRLSDSEKTVVSDILTEFAIYLKK